MILDEIVKATAIRVEQERWKEREVREIAQRKVIGEENEFLFEEKLRGPKISLICEVKKASPSRGVIVSDFDYVRIAKEYEEAGADAVSVLTEPEFFAGSIKHLAGISRSIQIPLLRKDFIVDAYQIYEAKVHGASAVLLICAILEDQQLLEYIQICDRLHLSALVEVHDVNEVSRAIQAGARVIGANNRDLRDFTVDIRNSIRLRKHVPEEILFVAESGIKEREDVRILESAGVNAMLVGETMMVAVDKKKEVMGLMANLGG